MIKKAVRKILLPFIRKLEFYDNIIEALRLGNESIRRFWEQKKIVELLAKLFRGY